jgi:hypothetical protein
MDISGFHILLVDFSAGDEGIAVSPWAMKQFRIAVARGSGVFQSGLHLIKRLINI